MKAIRKILHPEPLTKTQFAPFGDVIETAAAAGDGMNDGRFERFASLAIVDIVPPADAKIDIVRCLEPTVLPMQFDMLERHPLGTQAFIPLSEFVFVVVVAIAGTTVDPDGIAAFISNGRQGINYHRGTWHMPMIGMSAGQSFLIVDRGDDESNCDEFRLPEPIVLAETPVRV